jgi:hypothetical protein
MCQSNPKRFHHKVTKSTKKKTSFLIFSQKNPFVSLCLGGKNNLSGARLLTCARALLDPHLKNIIRIITYEKPRVGDLRQSNPKRFRHKVTKSAKKKTSFLIFFAEKKPSRLRALVAKIISPWRRSPDLCTSVT